MDLVKRPGWDSNRHIIANLSYALSSIVYTQNHISIDVVSKKEEMRIVLNAYQAYFSEMKIVVEAGCSLISNLCYSNKECK